MKKSLLYKGINLLLATACICSVPAAYGQSLKSSAGMESSYKYGTQSDDGDEDDSTSASGHASARGSQKILFGVEVGVNMANYMFKNDIYSYNNDMVAGARAGVMLDMPISRQLYFQPGAFYVMNGTKASYNDGVSINHETINVNTIEVPTFIMYKTGKPYTNRLFVGIGPYAAYNVSGNITNASAGVESGTLKIGSNKASDQIKPMDFGAGASAGVQLACGFFIRLRYEYSFFNLTPNTNARATIKYSSFGLNVGYLFGQHCRAKK